MKFAEWEPVYEAILSDFGYPREDDERARDRLAELLAESTYNPHTLDLSGTVAVAGAADCLREELDLVRDADSVVAASTAAAVIQESGLEVDCLVTDLDGSPELAPELTASGVPVAVHAHGDNTHLLDRLVPTLRAEFVIPTTQAEPTEAVHNFGGFTDGDRAAFLADACGAETLCFPGWEFDDPTVSDAKAQKLAWAERLLYWLETRRGERLSVLDGRRDGLSLPTTDRR